MATRRDVNIGILSTVAAAATATNVLAQGPEEILLPAPVTEGGKPLMQALKDRRSIRDYADRPLPRQVLANLLWAAWGVNRPAIDGRTAPHWHNAYALDIYLAMADGVWLHDPHSNRMLLHAANDLRALTTTGQAFVATAPLNLIYAFDAGKLSGSENDRIAAAAACAAVVAQNVYLYCASEGLATVLRQSVPGEKLAKALKLPAAQIIQFAQTVGYPKS